MRRGLLQAWRVMVDDLKYFFGNGGWFVIGAAWLIFGGLWLWELLK